MITVRTPLRISFAGGGTDIHKFYSQYQGAVVSATINKYCYVTVHKSFDESISLKYSNNEVVNSVEEIQFKPIRKALELFGIDKQIEIDIISDVPKSGGSGLGSSTSFSLSLFQALSLYKYRSQMMKMMLAREVTRFEIDDLENKIGLQDQFSSVCGGLNFITFSPDGSVVVEQIFMKPEVKELLQNRLMLFYTGITRSANTILKDQQDNLTEDKIPLYKEMANYAYVLREELMNNDIENFGTILHYNWLIKKQLSDKISNEEIDKYYDIAMENGAEGGKILGAGGGGFLLFYVRQENRDKLRTALSDLREFPFMFENQGTTVIYNE